MSELSRTAGKKLPKLSNNQSTWIKKIIKYLSFAILAIVICVAVFIGFLYMKADKMIDKIGDNNPPPLSQVEDDPDSPIPDGQVPQKDATKPLSLLLLGTDYREETHSLNTDVIMIAALNPEDKSATLVSLPRDLIMRPEGLPERKANYYYAHFYSQNKETANQKIKKVFSDFMKIPIDYVVTINFGGFEQVIDELGGLTIDVDQNMRYVDTFDGTDINLKKGVQKLNGKQTLDFIRYRKSHDQSTPESNDLQRNQRQQQVLNQVVSKLKSIGGVLKLGQIIDVIGNNLKTDIPSAQIRDMIRTYFGIDPGQIEFIQPAGQWVSPYIYIDNDDLQNARRALRTKLGMDEGQDSNIYEPAIKPPVQKPSPPVTNNHSSGSSNGSSARTNDEGSTPSQEQNGQSNENTPNTNPEPGNSDSSNQSSDRSEQTNRIPAGSEDESSSNGDPNDTEREDLAEEEKSPEHPDSTHIPSDQNSTDQAAEDRAEQQNESPSDDIGQGEGAGSDGVTDLTDEPSGQTETPAGPSQPDGTEEQPSGDQPGYILDHPLGIPDAPVNDNQTAPEHHS